VKKKNIKKVYENGNYHFFFKKKSLDIREVFVSCVKCKPIDLVSFSSLACERIEGGNDEGRNKPTKSISGTNTKVMNEISRIATYLCVY